MIRIHVNGTDTEIEPQTVLELILSRSLTPEMVVIEKNGDILRRDTWKTVRLENGDAIEIVHFVSGG
jgi:thiamine biosynthesis protein ThiS